MEWALGVEPTSKYLSFETAAAARKLVEQVMLVKPGESVAITADTNNDWRVVEATAQAVMAAGASPVVVWYQSRERAVIEPPGPVAGAIEQSDVWIEFAVAYLLHTEAYKKALAAGTRYINLTGMDADMLVRCIGRVDYPKVIEFGNTLSAIYREHDDIHLLSPAGTDLHCKLGERLVRQSGKLGDTPGEPIMLVGQVSMCPIEESIEGTLVFDGALWPPAELGRLTESIVLTVKEGRVTDISGGRQALVFKRWMESLDDPNMYRLAHFSPGFNPGVTVPTGRIVEDERVFGSVEWGLGSQGAHLGGLAWDAAGHTDGIVLNPTVVLDGKTIEKNGVYTHPDLVRICAELGISGYE